MHTDKREQNFKLYRVTVQPVIGSSTRERRKPVAAFQAELHKWLMIHVETSGKLKKQPLL